MSDLDRDGFLVTDTGRKIPRLDVTPALFIDRTNVIYGPSKTGKTVIVKNIMDQLRGHIEQALVVAPSEPSNRSYTGYIDPPFIHYRLYMPNPDNPKKDEGNKGALRFLETVWKRQEMMAAIYTRANKPRVLESLYGRLPSGVKLDGLRHIKDINRKRERVVEQVRAKYADDSGRRDEKVKEVNERFKTMLVLLYKRFIAPYSAKLWGDQTLSEDEKYTLNYLTFNPRLLLIFDDCAAMLKPFFNKEIFRCLFYQNRHSFITVVLCCQDDTDLPANLRKQAFISFFTESIVCGSNFDRKANYFSKDTKQFVTEITRDVFQGHRKLAYIREDDKRQHFYHVTFPYPAQFRFGSQALHELCDEIQSTETTMDRDNPFYDHFKLQ